MPIPPPIQLRTQAIGYYGMSLGPEAIEYLDALFGKVTDGWKKWQDSIAWGTLIVAGGGVGAWAGVGNGGMMQGSPYVMQPFSFKQNSPQQLKYTKGLADALAAKFTAFPATFKFTGVQYTGSCGATPINPGPVNAQNVPVPLLSAGSGQNPSGIAGIWKAALTPPDFDINNPAARSGQLIDAVCKAIEQSFQTVWLASTMIQGNILSGAAAAGGVVAGFPSGFDGKLK